MYNNQTARRELLSLTVLVSGNGNNQARKLVKQILESETLDIQINMKECDTDEDSNQQPKVSSRNKSQEISKVLPV